MYPGTTAIIAAARRPAPASCQEGQRNVDIISFTSKWNAATWTGSVSTERTNLQLLGEMVSDDGGEGGEERCEEHTHISDVDGDVEEVQYVVKGRRRHHQTCTANVSDLVRTNHRLIFALYWNTSATVPTSCYRRNSGCYGNVSDVLKGVRVILKTYEWDSYIIEGHHTTPPWSILQFNIPKMRFFTKVNE